MTIRVGLASAALVASPVLVSAQAITRDYLVLVASESVDRVALIRFGANGAKVEKERYVGWAPTEVAGPHGLAVSPDKQMPPAGASCSMRWARPTVCPTAV